MRKLLTLTTALVLAQAAYAQDRALDVLEQPPMSDVTQPGTQSKPVEEASAVRAVAPALAPVITEEKKTAPEKSAEAIPEKASRSNQLHGILAHAYTDSPTLRAEREVLRQQYENVAQADSFMRPAITLDGGVTWTNAKIDPGADDDYTTRDAGVVMTQYLYRGGRTLAQIEQQLRLSDAALAAYDESTQNTFLNVVTAAMDIQRDRKTIELTESNRSAISRQLDRVQRQFDVGELTRTDVAQSRARVSGADADLIGARADYANSLARFRQYAGADGDSLEIGDETVNVPESLEAAQNLAQSEHPLIRSAQEAEKAAQNAVALARGGLLPEVYMTGVAGTEEDPGLLIESTDTAAIGVRASMPLYEGGAIRSQLRQAKYGAFEQQERVTEAKRVVRRTVDTAWNDYQAAKVQIDARSKQVEAARLARDGVYKERDVGTRTVIDTLNADAELLDAEVGLVRARRDEVVAGYALLAATGQLTGEKLGFYTAEGEKANLKAARRNWFGTGAKPRP